MRQIRRNIARWKGIPWHRTKKRGSETIQSRYTKWLVQQGYKKLMKKLLEKGKK